MKLLIADDHALFRDTLTEYIHRVEPEAEVLVASDLQGVITYIEANEIPDLILLDFFMPGMKGLKGLEELKSTYPDIDVVLMSGMVEPEVVEEAIEKGIIGYFPKTMSGKAFIKAIQIVLTGEKFFSLDPEARQLMPSYYADTNIQSQLPKDDEGTAENKKNIERLSARESEVLSYLLKGSSNKEIANILELQEVTIKLHVRGVCRKLGAKNRTQAALIAKECGFEEHA